MKKNVRKIIASALFFCMTLVAAACSFSYGDSTSSSSSVSSCVVDSDSSTNSSSNEASSSDETPDDSSSSDLSSGSSDETSSDETPDDSSSDSSDEASSDETPDDSSSDSSDEASSDETPDDSSSDSSDEASSDETPDDSSSDSSDEASSDETPDDSSSDSSDETSSEESPDNSSSDNTPDQETYDRIDIHFLEIGNRYTGDCTYIKAGDTDILIDAGSRKDSAATITSYVNQYCTDGKLEYVIATHAHQDHIVGFVGENNKGIFDVYRVGTLIDFPRTDATTQIYKNYKTKRSNIISKYGTKHYTALQWWNGVDGLTRSIEIANGITMTILYQKYYEKSGDENDYSVCVMFSQGDNHYLFTGDLEKAGEESLVASNNLPQVKLYKAGHHGSKTSSNSVLIDVIRPEVVCVCCCAGSSEYNAAPLNTFPTQDFINRVAKYTDKIYVTSLAINNSSGSTTGFTSMNGNITVSSFGGALTVKCSNNNTILKETDWFKKNRTWPSYGV